MEDNFLIQDVTRAERSKEVRKITEKRERKPIWREYMETAIIALVAAILLRIFVVSAYRVSSSSMADSLYAGDYIFVNKMAYDFGNEPQLGDIIVFKYPNNPEKEYIKRIVAFGGETVQIADKIVYVDDAISHLPPDAKHTDQRIIPADLSYRDNFGPYTTPAGEYFVMGDNRDDSRDSRFWGSVPRGNIVGKAVFVYWSWTPNPDAPEWEFPYIVETFQWIGYGLFNFPSHTRWERLGASL